MFIIGLAAIPAFVVYVFSRPEWRLAVGSLALALFIAISLVAVWTLRGWLIERNFDMLLRAVSDSPSLRDIHKNTRHVFCATEVQVDETVYLARDAVKSPTIQYAAPGNLPTALAVRASAAFPGAFPPVVLALPKRNVITVRTSGRDTTRPDLKHVVLVDGGVRDNLGIDWFEQPGSQPDELIVVSSSANRHAYTLIRSMPGLSEAWALLNLLWIPYNTRERNARRSVLAQLYGRSWNGPAEGASGTIVHIEDSPLDLAAMIRWRAQLSRPVGSSMETVDLERWDADQIVAVEHLWSAAGQNAELLVQRAKAVADHLVSIEGNLPDPPSFTQSQLAQIKGSLIARSRRFGARNSSAEDAEAAWWARTQTTAQVGTKLSTIARHDAENLILHGYYLTMANLHVCAGWQLLKALDRNRLGKLFSQVEEANPTPKRQVIDEVAELLSRRLQPIYPVLVFTSVYTMVRQAGKFVQKRVVLVFGVGPDGQIEILGIWMAPSITEIPIRPDYNDVLRAKAINFWTAVLSSMHDRGYQSSLVFVRDIVFERFGRDSVWDVLDHVLERALPRTAVLPRLAPHIETSIRQAHIRRLDREGRDELRKDFEKVFHVATASAGSRELQQFMAKWSERTRDNVDHWLQQWDTIAPFYIHSIETRQMLQTIDSSVQRIIDHVKRERWEEGTAPADEVALNRILRILRDAMKTSKKIPSWRGHLSRLETECRP